MKKILIVDDSSVMRLYIRLILESQGYEIGGEAENGIIAIMKYAELKPDIVTMDIEMPEMDGIQALKKIKEFDENAKVVIVSAIEKEDAPKGFMELGASGFIKKPFETETIVELLNTF